MSEIGKSKTYDVEDRTFEFARRVRAFVRKIHKEIPNIEDAKQVVRSSGSVGANYIEANEALSKKDFLMRTRISRKEAKESHYWLRLFAVGTDEWCMKEQGCLVQEAKELTSIFGAIVTKSQ